MDFLRQQLTTINERLAGLTATQKMLTAALAVIVVMTLLYWGKGAASTEMVPVLPGVVSGEELVNVTKTLASRGIAFETNAKGQIVVASARQEEALAAVSFNSDLRADSTAAFADMLAKTSPLDTDGKWNAQLNNYNEQRLARVISFGPGIASAEVTIRQPSRGLGIARDPGSAHVGIRLKPDNTVPRRRIAEGAANVVATSIGVDRSKVGITIEGQAFNLADPNSGGGDLGMDSGELVAQKRRWEDYYVEKILKQFSDIEGLKVDVTVELDTETSHITTHGVDGQNKVVLPLQQNAEKTSMTEASQASADPGVMSNVPLSVNSPRPSQQPVAGSTSDKTEDMNKVDYGTKDAKTFKPAGMAKATGAALRVPLSYFTRQWALQNRGPAQGADFDAFTQAELERMKGAVKLQADIGSEAAVYATVGPALPTPEEMRATGGPMLAAADASGGSLKLFAAGHAKDVAVGMLALASLFMVGRMVKKSAPATPDAVLALDNTSLPMGARTAAHGGALAAKVRGSSRSGNTTLKGSEDVAGDVIEAGPVMMGQELDEAILETSQMVEQVGTFVKDSPDAAAQLVNRWMNRE